MINDKVIDAKLDRILHLVSQMKKSKNKQDWKELLTLSRHVELVAKDIYCLSDENMLGHNYWIPMEERK